MLKALHISDFVLIDSLDVQFPEGLIIITGQTGAGKSIILGALSLLMGGKADTSQISQGAQTCVVEAEFTSSDKELRALLEQEDIDWQDGSIIVRRTLSRTGRSRCFVNDNPVQQHFLEDISSYLIDIHSQHQSLLLGSRSFQRGMLDAYAGAGPLLEDCRQCYKTLKDTRAELDSVNERLARLDAEQSYNESQFKELSAASLRQGELEELETEQKALANAEEILQSLQSVQAMMGAGESSAEVTESTDTLLRESFKQLQKVSRFVPAAATLGQRMESLRIELDDIMSEIGSMSAKIDVSQDRLQAVEDRMALLYDLMRKHSCRSVDELIAVRDKFSGSIQDTADLEKRRSELESLETVSSSALNAACSALTDIRRRSAEPFAKSILDDLHYLELDRASFSVDIEPGQPGPDGADSIQFLFSSTGKSPVPVSKCASGGELSRIMLCLKAMMAQYTNMPTMIFDEIDTGVSGSVADKMGSMICRMGHDMQVFAITHLPQVAAKGDAHYLVTKSFDESGEARTSIRSIDSEERVHEIARMLSGSSVTPAAIANAKELLRKE